MANVKISDLTAAGSANTGMQLEVNDAGTSKSVTVGNIHDAHPAATTSAPGVVQLSTSTSSTSTVLAATPSAVKLTYDLASTANATANAALPASGGTLTGNTIIAAASASFTVNATSGSSAYYWQTAGTNRWVAYADTSGNLTFGVPGTADYLRLTSAGAMTLSGNTVWTAGNDGTGSGLDADLLDGVEASALVTKAEWWDGVGVSAPEVAEYDYARSLPYARTIENLRFVCTAGTATVELKDDGGVLATMSVSTTPGTNTDISHTVAAAERLYLNVTAVSSCEGLEVWFGGS